MVGQAVIIIRACGERARFVDYLLSRLPGSLVVWDLWSDAMETFLRALEAAGDSAALHMEDDVLLTRDFVAKAAAVLERHGDRPVQFFSLPRKRDALGSRLEPGRTFCMGQCFYLPPGMSRKLLEYAPTWPRRMEHPTGLDLMVADFLRGRRQQYWLHMPSLVQHRRLPSLIDPRRSKSRQSASFVDPDDEE
jgi:hypothetical protein